MSIEVFGVIRENKCEPNDTWWWKMVHKNTIGEKKNATNIYVITEVMKTYRSTKKLEETQRKL
jgi:hypothetical protein